MDPTIQDVEVTVNSWWGASFCTAFICVAESPAECGYGGDLLAEQVVLMGLMPPMAPMPLLPTMTTLGVRRRPDRESQLWRSSPPRGWLESHQLRLRRSGRRGIGGARMSDGAFDGPVANLDELSIWWSLSEQGRGVQKRRRKLDVPAV